MKDKLFIQAYDQGKKTGSWGTTEIHWRAYITCWVANRVKNLEGEFVECGVNKGGSALMVMNYIGFKDFRKTFYLLDTFSGLSEKYISDKEKKLGVKPGGYEECYADVQETFREFPNVRIIRGSVPDTLPMVQAEKVCYLSLDMNCALPEIAAAEFFWDKMVSGAAIVSDDYGWTANVVQKQALDDFAARKGVQVLALPTGQGLIFKP